MGGTDQILGVVMLGLEFDVSNCGLIVLVRFLRSVAKDLTVKPLISTHCFKDGGYGPDTRSSHARSWI